MTSDFPRLVVDANIMISATLGNSFPFLLRLFEGGVILFAPTQQLAETRQRVGVLSGLPMGWVDAQMDRLLDIIVPLHPVLLEKHEERAKSRLGPRGQPDWPILAACYETKAAAWSHDKDLFGSGAAVWSTKVLMRQMNFAMSSH